MGALECNEMGSRFRNQLAVDVATLVPGVKEKERGRGGVRVHIVLNFT